jgi:hypothetical protein
MRWRQRLPVPGTASVQSPDELIAGYREIFRELGQDFATFIQQEQVIRSFLAARGRTDV